ncbi:isoprenylcysteine carboxylmethyltransferase family protein [Pseudomonas sp. MYb185]|uniref:methyltransferase family protein n=1 Tax=Pseudomonas sp. MYb185 TaxID=1848729 RepID=UPI000CFC2020|nr:isoprenylcysteine carboxylmethyltransferase family protein [Pseudomonas sp. MYb185]PRB82660.1 isoprenylcysteine carboxyl methyltransferase [Pseudomonas sp. MYb185]
MFFSIVALCCYSLLILLAGGLELADTWHWWIARLIVMLAFAAGLVAHGYCTRALRPLPELAGEAGELKAKVLAVRLCLLALIVFSTLMGQLFGNWSATTFNLDYLLFVPLLLVCAPYYVRWAESIAPAGCDGYARLGQFVLRQRSWQWAEQKELLLAWLVKLIFIPLMYSWLMMATESLLAFRWSLKPATLISGLYMYGLAIDLLVATAGYLFASRILGNAVISTDKSWSGWLVCLLCYPPLIWVFQQIKQQTNELVWTDWLQLEQSLFWFWSAAITLTWLVYWLSTLHFGLRFANLSWRGLVNTGPYRWVRHPAYLSKNLYWWLYLVPFYGVASGYELARNLLGLCFVSLVYFLRAYTEERHLMQFAEYRDYVEHIRNHGLVARVKRWCGLHV